MATFTKEDLQALARLCAVRLDEQELMPLTNQISSILDYAAQLQAVDTTGFASVRFVNQNVLRTDTAVQSGTADTILDQAPKRTQRYFTVPQILEQTK